MRVAVNTQEIKDLEGKLEKYGFGTLAWVLIRMLQDVEADANDQPT